MATNGKGGGGKQKSNGSRVRLADVAAHMGVSRSTVASVLLDSAGRNVRVSTSTAARVRQVAAEMGFLPNYAAQRLAGKRSRIIGVLIDSEAPPTRYRQLSALERIAYAAGYRILVGQSHENADTVVSHLRDFVANDIAGLVCLSHDYPDIGMKLFRAFDLVPNTVYIGRPRKHAADRCWVGVDHRAATVDLVMHLREQGRTQPVLLLTDDRYEASLERKRGFEEALRTLGVSDGDRRVAVVNAPALDWHDPGCQNMLAPVVDSAVSRGDADAFLAANDVVAMQIVRALDALGRRVPEDVAVCGYDDLPTSGICRPSLTTVDLRDRDMAEAAFRLLVRLMSGETPPPAERSRIFRGRLVVRESTAGT